MSYGNNKMPECKDLSQNNNIFIKNVNYVNTNLNEYFIDEKSNNSRITEDSVLLDLKKVEEFLNDENRYKIFLQNFPDIENYKLDNLHQDIFELLFYPIYQEYKCIVDKIINQKNIIVDKIINQKNSIYKLKYEKLKHAKRLQNILAKMLGPSGPDLLHRKNLKNNNFYKKFWGKYNETTKRNNKIPERCIMIHPYYRKLIDSKSNITISNDYIKEMKNEDPKFLNLEDLRNYNLENPRNPMKNKNKRQSVGKHACSLFLNGKTKKIMGKYGNTNEYLKCKSEIGAHTERVRLNPSQGGKKPVKKLTTKKPTTKKPLKKPTTKKTTTKKPVKKTTTKKVSKK